MNGGGKTEFPKSLKGSSEENASPTSKETPLPALANGSALNGGRSLFSDLKVLKGSLGNGSASLTVVSKLDGDRLDVSPCSAVC